jgi:anti-sigma factor RsiW
MICIDGKKLSAYTDGELPEEEAAEIREHLTVCEACREELSRLESVSAALEALEGTEPDPYFASRLKRAAAEGRSRGWPGRVFVPAAAAAAAALSLAAGVFLGQALLVESNGASSNGNGALASYLGVAPVEDFPQGSLGDAWGEVWAEGENR